MKITILGNNSALPAYGRYPTCQGVEVEGKLILVDCGEAAQILLKKHHISWRRIEHIFISHLHGDHYFGLAPLLNSMSLLGRTNPLHLYAPKELEPMLQQIMEVADSTFSYPLHFKALPAEPSTLFTCSQFTLTNFPVEHRIFCQGLRIVQHSKGRKIIPEACQHYHIPQAFYKKLQAGEDYENKEGELIKNEWLTAEGKPEKRYVYCADTLYTESFLSEIQNVDLMYHESTYLSEDENKATARYHSTAAQAATLAQKAQVGQLILGHYSSRYKDIEPFEKEAQLIFQQTTASKEGDVFTI